MKHVALVFVPFVVVCLLNDTLSAQESDRPRQRPSFDYGGAPEFDKPPLGRDEQHNKPIDILFLDAEKKGYVDNLDKLLPLIRPGGLILGHDMHRPILDTSKPSLRIRIWAPRSSWWRVSESA